MMEHEVLRRMSLQVWARARALAWARAWLEGWPRMKNVALAVEKRVRQSGKPWEEVWTLAFRIMKAGTEPVTSLERSKLYMNKAAVELKERGQAEALALELAGIWGWARSEARARGESVPSALADSSTILRSLTILNRSGLANLLWHGSPETRGEYLCIVHFIAPITRLPFELLRQVFLIIVENTNDPPSALMLVCKHWHYVVTSIWASINLGTRTPIDPVTRRLEWTRWLLDIVVDTDSDRGAFSPSNGAFDAIFAVMGASSRWRSLVVESFPPRADLPEDVDIVNRRLPRYSNNSMSRFTTFRIKSACETSPLLDGLLHILGMAASPVLSTVEINSANVISFLAPAYPSMFHSVKVLSLDIQ